MNHMATIHEVPEELLLFVFSYVRGRVGRTTPLSLRTRAACLALLRVAGVCRLWRRVAQDAALWREMPAVKNSRDLNAAALLKHGFPAELKLRAFQPGGGFARGLRRDSAARRGGAVPSTEELARLSHLPCARRVIGTQEDVANGIRVTAQAVTIGFTPGTELLSAPPIGVADSVNELLCLTDVGLPPHAYSARLPGELLTKLESVHLQWSRRFFDWLPDMSRLTRLTVMLRAGADVQPLFAYVPVSVTHVTLYAGMHNDADRRVDGFASPSPLINLTNLYVDNLEFTTTFVESIPIAAPNVTCLHLAFQANHSRWRPLLITLPRDRLAHLGVRGLNPDVCFESLRHPLRLTSLSIDGPYRLPLDAVVQNLIFVAPSDRSFPESSVRTILQGVHSRLRIGLCFFDGIRLEEEFGGILTVSRESDCTWKVLRTTRFRVADDCGGVATNSSNGTPNGSSGGGGAGELCDVALVRKSILRETKAKIATPVIAPRSVQLPVRKRSKKEEGNMYKKQYGKKRRGSDDEGGRAVGLGFGLGLLDLLEAARVVG